MNRLVSPHGFDGRGPVPKAVTEASLTLASHRKAFLLTGALTPAEIREVLDAASVHAEWMRELYEVVHEE